MRKGNFEFRKCSYLCEEPENPSWCVDYWYPNPYYGKEDEYPEDPINKNFRMHPKYHNHRIDKGCFKYPESCFSLVNFDCDKNGYYEVHFIYDRPFNLDPSELETFWKVLEYGHNYLNLKHELEDGGR